MSSMLLLSGCGGSDSDDSNNGQNTGGNNSGGNNNGGSTTTTADWTNEDAVNWITHSAVSVVLPYQFLDQLILDTDDFVYNDQSCTTGSYTNINSTLTFNNCKTNFIDDAVTLSGTIKYSISDGSSTLTYQNLVLTYDDNSKATLAGTIDIENQMDSDALILIDDFKVVSDEEYDGKQYSMTTEVNDYTLSWVYSSETAYSIEASGKMNVINSPFKDFSINFETTGANLFSESDLPYDGGLKVVDANNAKNYSILDYNNDAATLLYQSYANDKLVINRTLEWFDVYDF